MIQKIILTIVFLIIFSASFSQKISPITAEIMKDLVPEHGFLPGKKFPIFKTINKYDFEGLNIKVKLFDDRDSLKIKMLNCSEVNFTNDSEFASPQTIFKVQHYIDSIFHQAGIVINSASLDKLEIRLEAIDSRLIGFGKARAHGLCQIRVKYKTFDKVYCTDIVDGDEHSPLGTKAFVTRRTATRYMASASIRENLEKFLIDLKMINKSR